MPTTTDPMNATDRLTDLTALENMAYQAMRGITVGLTRAIGGVLVTRASHTICQFVVSGTSVSVPPKDAAQLLCCSVEFDRARLTGTTAGTGDLMDRAFQLVQPGSHWKDPIDARVGTDQMSVANVRLVDIVESIEFHTATLTRLTVLGLDPKKGLVYSFKAAGYRAGPAGDR